MRNPTLFDPNAVLTALEDQGVVSGCLRNRLRVLVFPFHEILSHKRNLPSLRARIAAAPKPHPHLRHARRKRNPSPLRAPSAFRAFQAPMAGLVVADSIDRSAIKGLESHPLGCGQMRQKERRVAFSGPANSVGTRLWCSTHARMAGDIHPASSRTRSWSCERSRLMSGS